MPAGKNICDCPRPPGGWAVCNADQLAICRVVNGVAYTECVDVPGHINTAPSNVQLNWAKALITQQQVPASQGITPADMDMLQVGRFDSPVAGEVHFSLPKSFTIFRAYRD